MSLLAQANFRKLHIYIYILMVLMHFLKTKIQIFPCWRKLTSTNYIPGVCVFMVLLLPKKTKISNYPCWRKLTYTNYIYVFLWVCWFLKRLKSQIFLARTSLLPQSRFMGFIIFCCVLKIL